MTTLEERLLQLDKVITEMDLGFVALVPTPDFNDDDEHVVSFQVQIINGTRTIGFGKRSGARINKRRFERKPTALEAVEAAIDELRSEYRRALDWLAT